VGDKLIFGLFVGLCVLGIVAALFPQTCSPSKNPQAKLEPSRTTTLGMLRLVHGHHPSCEEFVDHEFAMKGKKICVGCAGLIFGAVSASLIAASYFFYDYKYPFYTGYVGLVFVFLGLMHIPLFRVRILVLRFVFNALFVIGFAFLIVAVDGVGSSSIDLITIGLFINWIYTRIQVSRWDHDSICLSCGQKCEDYVLNV